MYHAIHYGNFEVAEFLIKCGASPNAEFIWSGNKYILLTKIINEQNGAIEKVKFLLDHGADPNIKKGKNKIAVLQDIVGSSGNNEKIIELLLKYGADPNTTDINGATPLYKAGSTTIQILLNYGANPNIQNNEGLTPLQYISSLGNKICSELSSCIVLGCVERIQALLKGGANIIIGDNIDELAIIVKKLLNYNVSEEAIVTSLLIANKSIDPNVKINFMINEADFTAQNIELDEVIEYSIYYYYYTKRVERQEFEDFQNGIKQLAECSGFKTPLREDALSMLEERWRTLTIEEIKNEGINISVDPEIVLENAVELSGDNNQN